MLGIVFKKSPAITTTERVGNALVLSSEAGQLRLAPQSASIVRVSYTLAETFTDELGIGILQDFAYPDWVFQQDETVVSLCTDALRVTVNKRTGSIAYYDATGALLLAERAEDSHELDPFDSYKTIVDEHLKLEVVDTPDGKKTYIREGTTVFDRKLYRTRLNLSFQENEKIYGLGQFEEGDLNLRGTTQYLHQANLKIPIPFFLSTAGYGVLSASGSPAIFSDTRYGSYFYTEADVQMDFYFIAGKRLDDVIKGYRFLTGKAAMLPRWAFGFVQSQERYETQAEVLEVAKEYRSRKIGLDLIVMDWMSWEGENWGQKTFDFGRFPNPRAMTDALHEEHVKFMISIWPNMNQSGENHKEFAARNLLMLGSDSYDVYNPQAQALYWKQANEGLFQYGIDAWWCDSCEPFCPEWSTGFKPEPSKMYAAFWEVASKAIAAEKANTYPLLHAKTIYDGQRAVTADKRVCNLTRATYTGGQKYGTILWSGDTFASWETLQNQIVAGLNFCAAGLPYWTLDIGAFFVKKADKWFRNGGYNAGLDDLGYKELFVRWFQYGAFLPVFRSHGTDVRREMWMFDGEDHRFYDALVKANELRYTLIPYIYSIAGTIWRNDDTIMRMLAFDFAQDDIATSIKDEFMFGESLLVCPITQANYYEKESTPLQNPATHKAVYLPSGWDWFDFYTDEKHSGGQWIQVPITLDKIPLFVKAGSIIPRTEPLQCTDALDSADITLHIYKGADATFTLYHDAADGYGYEQGEYETVDLCWREQDSTLVASAGKPYTVIHHG